MPQKKIIVYPDRLLAMDCEQRQHTLDELMNEINWNEIPVYQWNTRNAA